MEDHTKRCAGVARLNSRHEGQTSINTATKLTSNMALKYRELGQKGLEIEASDSQSNGSQAVEV